MIARDEKKKKKMKANLIAVQSNALVTLILPRAQVPLNKRRWWSRLRSNSPPSFSGLRGDIYVKKKGLILNGKVQQRSSQNIKLCNGFALREFDIIVFRCCFTVFFSYCFMI